MLGTIARIPMTNPFVFGVVFSTFKTSFSDWVVQRFVERRKEIDWRRNGTFAAFGCFYLGGVQYMIYVPFFQRIFPTAKAFTELPFAKKMTDFAGQRTVAYQVFIDQFVHHPLLYFPFFYTLKELVNGGPIDGGIKKCAAQFSRNSDAILRNCSDAVSILRRYMTNYKEDLVALWKLWVPSTFLNFALMPMWARIPWVATTSLLWTCILSAMRGSEGTFEAHEELAEDIMLNPGRALTRALSNMESDYDRTQAHIVINAAGPDRVGYVHALASAMTSTGGNLIESKMMRLGATPAAAAAQFSARNSPTQLSDARSPFLVRRRLHRDDADELPAGEEACDHQSAAEGRGHEHHRARDDAVGGERPRRRPPRGGARRALQGKPARHRPRPAGDARGDLRRVLEAQDRHQGAELQAVPRLAPRRQQAGQLPHARLRPRV